MSLVYQRGRIFYVSGLRISTGTDNREEAEAFAAKIKHDKWLQTRMGVKPARPWHQAAFKWLEEKAGKVSIQDDIERLKWLNDYLGTVSDISSITREQVDAIMQMRKGVSTSTATSQNCTANRYVSLIAGILNAAERQWSWGNRAPRLRYYKVRTDVGRALTVEEWKRLQQELPEPLRSTATFSLSTGMRAAKVFGLMWTQVNMSARTLSFTGTTNKIGNSIPMNATAMGVLKEIRSQAIVHQTNVFTYAGKPIKYYGKEVWRAALDRAGVPRIRFHDLRGTFISWLAQSGVPREIRMRLAGHKLADSHDRYVHLHLEHLRPYCEIVDTLLTQSSGQSESKTLAKVG